MKAPQIICKDTNKIPITDKKSNYWCVLFICFRCRVPSGRSFLMSEYHGTAPSACTVLLIVSPLRGDL